MRIATGFDFEPLPDGNVRIEFYGDDGETLSQQVVMPGVMHGMGLVSALTDVALRKGPEVAKEIMRMLAEDNR